MRAAQIQEMKQQMREVQAIQPKATPMLAVLDYLEKNGQKSFLFQFSGDARALALVEYMNSIYHHPTHHFLDLLESYVEQNIEGHSSLKPLMIDSINTARTQVQEESTRQQEQNRDSKLIAGVGIMFAAVAAYQNPEAFVKTLVAIILLALGGASYLLTRPAEAVAVVEPRRLGM